MAFKLKVRSQNDMYSIPIKADLCDPPFMSSHDTFSLNSTTFDLIESDPSKVFLLLDLGLGVCATV